LPSNPRPNILLIHTDQHRWDCLGANGNPDVQTPHVDAIAADGVTYTESFCCFPVCTPSRYSLLTGLYVHQHLGWTNRSTPAHGLETFPRILRRAGYATAAVGKMHFTPTYLDLGFERMTLCEQHGEGRWDDDYHRDLAERGLADRLDLMDQRPEYRAEAPKAYFDCFGARESDLPEEHHSTTWIGDRACEEIGRWSADTEKPSLLMVGFVKPHHPFDPPAPWSGMYDDGALTVLPGWTERVPPQDAALGKGFFDNAPLTEPALRRVMAMYYANISQIDYHVGRMIALLAEKGLYDDTLIVFTSDHGEYMGFHHRLLKSNHMYDPLVKVPLIIKPPGRRGGGTVSEALVSNVDVAPTLLAAAGCQAGPDMKGLDLATHPGGREAVFAEDGLRYMVRTRTHKLLLDRQANRSQLLDLRADPLEMENLLGRGTHKATAEDLRERLLRWALFDAPTPTHRWERAPRIDQPNVPALDDGHRQRMIDYYREKMAGAGEVVFGDE